MATDITPQGQLQQYGLGGLWNPNDPLMNLYEQIANNYKTSRTPPAFIGLAIASMMARMYLYYKNAPGDCQIPGGYVSTSAAVERDLAGGLQSVIGANTISNILNIFSQHHQQAVITEQATACDVAGKSNAAFARLDAYVAQGQMNLTQVLQVIENIRSMATAEFKPILKDCNTACVGTRVISCLCDLRKQIYQAADASPILGGSVMPLGGVAGAVTLQNGIQQAGSALTKTNNLTIAAIIATGAALTAKVAGVI